MNFSPTQATAFVAEWQVIDQIPDTASGFSATIFKNIKVGSIDFGKYTVAMRGTNEIVDLSRTIGGADSSLKCNRVMTRG